MASTPLRITEADLRQWRLIEVFRSTLDKIPQPPDPLKILLQTT